MRRRWNSSFFLFVHLLPMTSLGIYEPFKKFSFDDKHCFLSGAVLNNTNEQIPVFPSWLLQQLAPENQAIKLLDESIRAYSELTLPCDPTVFENYLAPLDKEIEDAFNKGYTAVTALDQQKLFIWIAKLIYGMIFIELRSAIKQQKATGEALNMSQSLIHKMGNLHLMMQSVHAPVVFEDFNPWSIHIVPLSTSDNVFSFRDEINTLTFSMKMKDFGIIACLQDNGTNSLYHREILTKLKDQALHTIQFDELSGRFYYSNYLFNRLPEYNIMPVDGTIYIEAMPLRGVGGKPLFDEWQNKTYGQVLENFWKKWDITLFEIIKDPENPMSFLFDQQGNHIPASQITKPV